MAGRLLGSVTRLLAVRAMPRLHGQEHQREQSWTRAARPSELCREALASDLSVSHHIQIHFRRGLCPRRDKRAFHYASQCNG